MKTKPLEIAVPFPGLYESSLDAQLDREWENHVEWDVEKQGDVSSEDWQPEELRLDEQTFFDVYDHCVSHTKMHTKVAEEFLKSLVMILNDETTNLEIDFDEMDSPREYNFSTDRLFGKISDGDAQYLFNEVDKATLEKLIRDKCTSRSGFCSFYSNDYEEWIKKPVFEWDANELGILLECFIVQKLGEDWEDLVEFHMAEADDFSTAFSEAMDWEKANLELEQKRDDLRAELDPSWVRPPNPCQHTRSLFDADPL